MKNISKGLGATFLLALSAAPVQAQIINLTLTGTVNSVTGSSADRFGLNVNDTVTAIASFDDSLLGSLFPVNLADPGNALTIYVGDTIFTELDDFGTPNPNLYFDDNDFFDGIDFAYNGSAYRFSGLSFSGTINEIDFDSSNFCCDFDGGVFAAGGFDGTWNSASVSAVPVPAAVWLFGSGLIGLAGVARRKAA